MSYKWVEYLKAGFINRIEFCNNYASCEDCPLHRKRNGYGITCVDLVTNEPKVAISLTQGIYDKYCGQCKNENTGACNTCTRFSNFEKLSNNSNMSECSEKIQKPSVGIKPERLWKEQRYNDLCAAILRYTFAEVAVPKEWVEEGKRLYEELEKENSNE